MTALSDEIKRKCYSIASYMEQFRKQADVMVSLLSVFKASIETMSQDKAYFLTKLAEMDKIADAMSDYLEELAEKSHELQEAISKEDIQPTRQPIAFDKRVPLCPTCGNPLLYVQQTHRWYCSTCKRYV